MRILVVSRELPPVGGGAGYQALNLGKQLRQEGHEVDFVTMNCGGASLGGGLEDGGVHAVNVGRRREDSSSLKEMARFVASGRRLVSRLASDSPYDVAHAHAIVPDGLLLGAVNTEARRVVTAHGSDVPGYNPDKYWAVHGTIRPVWKLVVRRADVVTTSSEYLRELMARAGAERTVHVVPYGIEPSLVERKPKERRFLMVARLVPRKNTHVLLEALKRVEEPTHVDVVGDGPERPHLERLAEELEAHTVRFHGWLAHGSPEWRRLYERCRFFASLSSSENLPVSLLEAQLARMVVVASDIRGNREALGEAARYVDEVSAEGVAEVVREVQKAPEAMLEAEGEAAAERVLTEFSWERVADIFRGLYADERG